MRREWLVALILSKKIRLVAEGISPDTATKLRGAWAIYDTIRRHDAAKARELRNRYGYRRFLELGILCVQYDISPADAIDHLESELSNAAMRMQIINAYDSRAEWERQVYGMLKIGEKLVTAYDIPDKWREWVKRGKELQNETGG